MGKTTLRGWRKSQADIPSPTAIVFGRNLRPSTNEKSEPPKSESDHKAPAVPPAPADKRGGELGERSEAEIPAWLRDTVIGSDED